MKKKIYDIDTPNREQLLQKACSVKEMNVLTTDYSALFAELIKQSEQLSFPCHDGKDYTFSELIKYQALFILEQIKAYPEDIRDEDVIMKQLHEWSILLQYNPSIKITRLLINLLYGETAPLDILQTLKSGYKELREDVESAGITDPSLATIEVFLHNYKQIASGFNAFWKRFPEYYIRNVLHVKPNPSLPDRTWLVLEKREETHDVVIPKQTAFIAGLNSDGSDFCYKSEEEVIVTGMKLENVSSILFEQNEILVDNNKIRYVNKILQKEINLDNPEQPTVMFGSNIGKDDARVFIPTGLMIESPMFISEEGNRNFSLEFHLELQSVNFFRDYARSMTNKENLYRDIYYRLVNDAFYLEISTEEGWTNIPQYELKYIENGNSGYFSLFFSLNYNVPKTIACRSIHSCHTEMPALRILINRNASIFPYTWARQIQFDKVVIINEVKGITNLEVINELGQQDVNSSFPPFGVQGDKGAWMVVGNYELSIKPISEASLYLKWLQVPQEIGGFITYYKDYKRAINNSSFKVKTEFLNEKNWIETSPTPTDLFVYNRKTECVESENTLVWALNKRMPTQLPGKDNFSYGKATSGFIRMVLDKPDFGFGNSVYQHLFINNFILRDKKEEIKLLNKPFIPTVDLIELNYKAVETITSFSSKQGNRTKFYYITPLSTRSILPIQGDGCSFVDGPDEDGYLKFGFFQAERYDRIRMYAELLPSHHEFEKSDVSPVKWYYNDGKQWIPIDEENISDGTEGFLNSGFIDIKLPMRIQKTHLDKKGLFWIYAAFEKNYLNYPSVYGFFLNSVKVVANLSDNPEHYSGTESLPANTIRNLQKEIPEIASITQPRSGFGGVKEESFKGMFFRSSNQVLFRNRPSTPDDYERIVLEKFPQIAKVKCFPGCDTKGNNRNGIVTLVVMQKKSDELLPLCTYDLLFDIEKEISLYTSPFVIIDAINPVFEEVMVRCKIILKAGTSPSLFKKEAKKVLDSYIAPWMSNENLPSFGSIISVAETKKILQSCQGVERVERISLAVLMVSTRKATLESQKIQELIEYTDEKSEEPIKSSYPWYIRIPAKKHLIITGDLDEYQDNFGIGELEIDNTLIIKQ
ncbi:hypothetical protein LJC52_02845 [Bacteroidales bacterium OttesenSCG-928-A17]|nr:hypothetical protein [Bacteroidales bacterium OttesenSCG-928-A17]